MRRLYRVAASLSAISGAAVAGPGIACSMVPGYRVPTNLELAAAANTIVIADVTGERTAGSRWDNVVLARPTTLLKGAALPQQIELRGASLSLPGEFVRTSAPRELRRPNPDALTGGCVRYVFTTGTKLVLFLKRDEAGKLVPYRSAFSRDAEDVTGDEALWVKAVREYAAISVLPRSRWKHRLRSRMTELRTTPGDADAKAIADDMAVELSRKRLPPTD